MVADVDGEMLLQVDEGDNRVSDELSWKGGRKGAWWRPSPGAGEGGDTPTDCAEREWLLLL
jgi:hypothetical protein